jgi:hypothetical protein
MVYKNSTDQGHNNFICYVYQQYSSKNISSIVFKKSSLEFASKIVESLIIQEKEKDILATIFLVHYFQE